MHCDAGPTAKQRWANVSCLLRCQFNNDAPSVINNGKASFVIGLFQWALVRFSPAIGPTSITNYILASYLSSYWLSILKFLFRHQSRNHMSVKRAHSDSSTPSPLAQNRGKKAGRYDPLRHPDQEEGTIEEAVKEGFAACSSQTSVTQPDRTSKKDKKSPSGKAGSSTSTAASEKRTPEMAHIFAEVMTALIPVGTAAVTAAVNAALLKQVQKTTEESMKRQGETIQQQQLLLNYQNYQLEQYSRRWNIRVNGLGEGDLSGLEGDAEETNEQLVNKIIKLVGACGVNIQPTDISICHRVWPKVRDGQRNRKRPVICRFISRTTKASVINNGRSLKSSDDLKEFISTRT